MVKRVVLGAAWVCAIVTLPWAAHGFQNESATFEQLQFGESVADVLKAYPSARKLTHEKLGATVVESPFIARYQVPDVRLAGAAHPVSFELRFWKEKLWVVIVYFGENSNDEIVRWLTARYGTPTAAHPNPAWSGKVASVVTSLKERWFSVADQVASKEISALLVESESMRRLYPPRATAPATGATPAATPLR